MTGLARGQAWRYAVIAVLALTGIGIVASRLSFVPVPWPDSSAFYLPGLGLVSWPPRWQMHSQAAFVPSYDLANFNIMPLLSLLLGLVARSGLIQLMQPQWLTRALSVVAMLCWVHLLWRWTMELLEETSWAQGSKRLARQTWGVPLAAAAVAAAALWDPVVRWGVLVVRTEIWEGLCLLWLLREMHRWERAQQRGLATALLWRKTAWRVAAGIAIAAYFHYQAVYFVPAFVVGLGFSRGWFGRLVDVGVRVVALLSPWIAYVFWHFPLFWEQMEVAFSRLSHANYWISNAYLTFHSLFIDHGSPAGPPKFFNVAKGAFWLGLLTIGALTLSTLGGTTRPKRALRAAGVAFLGACWLWGTKAEVWFVTLCHLTFWPWMGAALAYVASSKRAATWVRGLAGVAALYAGISLAAAFGQERAMSDGYTWPTYSAWIDCMEGTIPQKSPVKLWQPFVPDVLVELSRRHPDWDLTRTLDFKERLPLAYAAAQTMDVVLMTRPFNFAAGPGYTGPLRAEDRARLASEVDLPFGPWALEQVSSGRWRATTCERGPFWGVVLTH